MPLIPIQSLDDPRLADYANIRDAELAQRADPLDAQAHRGLFIAEGELVARRLFSSRYRTASVLTTPTRLESVRDAVDRLPPEVPVYLADQDVLNAVVGFNMHRGLLALGSRGRAPGLDDLLGLPGPIVVLEDLVNHDNLGGIYRNAAALAGPGVGVLLSPRCADPLYRKSLRVSMGHVLSVPTARSTSWPADLDRLRTAGFTLLATTPDPGATDLRDLPPAGRWALLLGSEGPGLSDVAQRSADIRVRIAMNPADPASMDSLNVAMAAGICLHRLAPPPG
jgi:tRNA G18 (ribose-2'-O)-methylase SpoU